MAHAHHARTILTWSG